MFLHMQGEVVRARKGALAHPAGVRPHPGVLPHVPPQLVRPRELPAAALPGANIGLLPGVSSHVSFHVAGLLVDLATGGVGAVVEHLAKAPSLPPNHQVGRTSNDGTGCLTVQPGNLAVLQHFWGAVLIGWVVLWVVLRVG